MEAPGAPDFRPLVGPYLARQDWAQAALGSFGLPTVPVAVVDVEVLRFEHPGMASVVVECGNLTFHLVLGWRETAVAPGVLGARPDAVLGPGSDSRGDVLVYDFIADQELVVALLGAVTGGKEQARRGRVVASMASHSSLIYDDRVFMKCYRVIEPGTRPEVEVPERLDAAGFNHMLAPVANWRRNERDLAIVREYVPGAVEGLALARTSLRDLLARAVPSPMGAAFEEVGLAGGDFAPEMRRLGETTGRMHLALASSFGTEPLPDGQGYAVRIHGDYHLRRVMRTDGGWLVAGFGDDPLMGESAGAASQGEPRFASPLEDIAVLCRSLGAAADEAVELQTTSTRTNAAALAVGWEKHNTAAFLRGYLGCAGIDRLIGTDQAEPSLESRLAALVEARRG